MSARDRAAGSSPPAGQVASTSDSTATAWTRTRTSWWLRLASAAAAQDLAASRNHSWAMREKSSRPERPKWRMSQTSAARSLSASP